MFMELLFKYLHKFFKGLLGLKTYVNIKCCKRSHRLINISRKIPKILNCFEFALLILTLPIPDFFFNSLNISM